MKLDFAKMRRGALPFAAAAAAVLAWAYPAQARVTKITILSKTSPAFNGQSLSLIHI